MWCVYMLHVWCPYTLHVWCVYAPRVVCVHSMCGVCTLHMWCTYAPHVVCIRSMCGVRTLYVWYVYVSQKVLYTLLIGCHFTSQQHTMYMRFSTESHLSHLRDIELFNNGRVTALKIARCGYYHIYSQITWDNGTNVNNNNNNNARIRGELKHATNIYTGNGCRDEHSHYVQRISPVMTSMKTLYDGIVTTATSYQAGSFLLCEGDFVYITIATNSVNCISTNEKETFFGAYMLRGCPANI